jgi:hypothetical protein
MLRRMATRQIDSHFRESQGMTETEAGSSADQPAPEARKDFFISYTQTDKQWAEWIAFELELAGYQVILQAWDFRPGANFIDEMNEATCIAERTIAVLSPAYLESDYAFMEEAVALRQDPRGRARKLLPVRVRPCQVEGLLGPLVRIDLVNLDEESARLHLLEGVGRERHKPASVPFPAPSTNQE